MKINSAYILARGENKLPPSPSPGMNQLSNGLWYKGTCTRFLLMPVDDLSGWIEYYSGATVYLPNLIDASATYALFYMDGASYHPHSLYEVYDISVDLLFDTHNTDATLYTFGSKEAAENAIYTGYLGNAIDTIVTGGSGIVTGLTVNACYIKIIGPGELDRELRYAIWTKYQRYASGDPSQIFYELTNPSLDIETDLTDSYSYTGSTSDRVVHLIATKEAPT